MNYAELILPSLLKGTLMTIKVFLVTLIFSIPLGLPLALGSESRWWPIRWIFPIYVFIFRGTPLMLQLFFVYFILPIYTGLMIDAVTSAMITFVLNYAAYLSEIYRGGIKSIDRGQYEAAACLGLSRTQTICGIVLPQMVRVVLPAVGNEMITLVKDTSLVYALG
ncbi:MAG: amino acid ABC transporter permease, partial [Firmicutes bacterium]|nr:amino acid ABC transporter permease [Bacillota bacterium]